jgi:septal ring factor EnvC (AmiA/AmiB activator)
MSPAVLTFAGVAFVAVCGLAGSLGASWISKRAADRQRAAQNAIDERKVDREEFDSLTRELRTSLNDVRTELAEERTARRESDRRAMAAEERAERAEQRIDRIAATLAAHGQWDLLVLAEVRRSNEDFPDPPPLVDVKNP